MATIMCVVNERYMSNGIFQLTVYNLLSTKYKVFVLDYKLFDLQTMHIGNEKVVNELLDKLM